MNSSILNWIINGNLKSIFQKRHNFPNKRNCLIIGNHHISSYIFFVNISKFLNICCCCDYIYFQVAQLLSQNVNVNIFFTLFESTQSGWTEQQAIAIEA